MKKFFQRVGSIFSRIFGGMAKFEKFLKENVDDAIDIVSKIRFLVDNPVVITIISILPDKYANQAGDVLEKIKHSLDKAIQELQISDQCLGQATFADRLRCLVVHLKGLSPAMRNAAYLKIGSLYTKHSSQANLKEHIYDAVVQNRFLEKKN